MGIFESTSRDGGVTFSPRARRRRQFRSAHPRLATTAAGAARWCGRASHGPGACCSARRGAAAAVSTGGIASYPAIAAVGDGFLVAWTDQAEGASVIRALRVR